MKRRFGKSTWASVARTISVETLTLDKLADIDDQEISEAESIRLIAKAPFEPEPLEVEARRHHLRIAYLSATSLILAPRYGWKFRRVGNRSPAMFTADPKPGASTEERVIMALAPRIALSRHLGRPVELPEKFLWRGMKPFLTGETGFRPERMAMAALMEANAESSYEGLIAAFRTLEAAAAARVGEPDTWSGIQVMAKALVEHAPSRETVVW